MTAADIVAKHTRFLDRLIEDMLDTLVLQMLEDGLDPNAVIEDDDDGGPWSRCTPGDVVQAQLAIWLSWKEEQLALLPQEIAEVEAFFGGEQGESTKV